MAVAKSISTRGNLPEVLAPIAAKISKITGVQLGPRQASQVRSRISQRMRKLKITTDTEYARFFDKNVATELGILISLLTTHYTFFFREFTHFEYLIDSLSSLISAAKQKGKNKLRVWSAAGSTGQEAYSLAMLLKYHIPLIDPSFGFEIISSDVDKQSVEHGRRGVYKWSELKSVPALYLSGNWARGKGEIAAFVKAKDRLKEHIKFETINLVELKGNQFKDNFDIIFCRNVFIYFSQDTIKKTVETMLGMLEPWGFFVSGLSEPLTEINLPIESLGKSVYGHHRVVELESKDAKKSIEISGDEFIKAPDSLAVGGVRPIRVLIVDDSPSIVKIMSAILSKEEGFTVVGSAANGIEASKFLKDNEVDVVTLDIHMPEQNGIEYLQTSFSSKHPPVVIVSSVSREDSGLAMKALNLGAFDYIEKPTLGNLSEIKPEICSKVKFAAKYNKSAPSEMHKISSDFSRRVRDFNPDGKLRNLFASISDVNRVVEFFRLTPDTQVPPTVIYLSHADSILNSMFDRLRVELKLSVKILDDHGADDLQLNAIYLSNISDVRKIFNKYSKYDTVNFVFGGISKRICKRIKDYSRGGIIVEDLGAATAELSEILDEGTDVYVPMTSFAYEGEKLFNSNEMRSSA
ncbi:MAG: CheR family methyltransferase [Bdellovibrionota bacterium]